MKIFFYSLFATIVIVLGLGLTSQIYLAKKVKLQHKTLIEVPKGASLTSIAIRLGEKDIIAYPRLFVKIGQLYGYDSSIKYGEYALLPGERYSDVFEKLVKGDNYKYEITFVEGDHMYKFARQLAEKGLCSEKEFLNLVKNKSFIKGILGESLQSLEGYLFPETYHFSKADGVEVIVRSMVKKFIQETEDINFSAQPLSRHQIITLASIIEKETGAAFERPLISSVFHNRLAKKMRLQTDPTIIYGIMHETGREINNIRKKDILRPSAYNTYVINGLPPGPIGNPGIEAIQATLKPKETQLLYFVSQNNGTHIFSKTYKEHLKAVKKYQLDPKMRQGKSWRDLKQKKRAQ